MKPRCIALLHCTVSKCQIKSKSHEGIQFINCIYCCVFWFTWVFFYIVAVHHTISMPLSCKHLPPLYFSPNRQLSEENANLHESVEKESTEKKRLSQNNEELLWLLHTSPLMSPASSPLHRSFSTSPIPLSPLLPSSPFRWCDSPTHCHGCPNQAQHCSPSHRAATNQNLSPKLVTPTHRAAANQNYSTGPNTPTHRVLASYFNANTSLQN